MVHSWRRRGEEVIPFLAFSPKVCKIIYTTNAIKSLHSQVRKAIRNKGYFPSDEAATKLIYLVLRNITAKWKKPSREWHAAKAQFAIQFGDRFVLEVYTMKNGSHREFCTGPNADRILFSRMGRGHGSKRLRQSPRALKFVRAPSFPLNQQVHSCARYHLPNGLQPSFGRQ